ncbi:uncharacterized protein N0V89_002253 [Didymosphaeria variabile]|uniref:Uncharacterized protein n=1 Tax=Didymosphaeria variabile TaxID=1932322 RepID=A0A9W8XUG1_9PLEO|nr:uncharacterized protein N0V89_002253 [Didymosphaeria variabile]KAJ4357677.1 hypothetical protein N0V89_002253 [Didymosphaeria variabile]
MFTAPSVSARGARTAASRSLRKRNQASYCDDSDEENYALYERTSNFKKRKPTVKSSARHEIIDLTADDTNDERTNSPKKKAKGDKGKDEEKRLRRFRSHPPQSYLDIKARALSQRLTIISRERVGTDDVPEERVVMAGSTGNVYTQQIGHVPSCDCPHAKKGNQCKHIVYVMLRVLKAPENIGYQLALTSSELRDLFRNAAPLPNADSGDDDQHETELDKNRKKIEGECPICYCDFEPGMEAIVYCKAACGNNVHKGCMQTWIAAKGAGRATCPYCRAKWEDDDIGGGFSGKVNLKGAARSDEGYMNIASQLGLSGERDYSSYHQPWAQRQGYGGYHHGRRW